MCICALFVNWRIKHKEYKAERRKRGNGMGNAEKKEKEEKNKKTARELKTELNKT